MVCSIPRFADHKGINTMWELRAALCFVLITDTRYGSMSGQWEGGGWGGSLVWCGWLVGYFGGGGSTQVHDLVIWGEVTVCERGLPVKVTVHTHKGRYHIISYAKKRRKNSRLVNVCIPFIQRPPNVSDVGPTLYKCYTNDLCSHGKAPMWHSFEWLIGTFSSEGTVSMSSYTQIHHFTSIP